MSFFYKNFLLEDIPHNPGGNGRQIYLAAFGKHPGWDDHIEDIGMATASLVLAKQLLYIQGIGGQIDSGAWDKLSVEQQLSQFHHLFVWQRADRFLLGRLWSSRDGKGRTRYPMVLCAHGMGCSLDWATAHVLPELGRIERACMGTTSAYDVQQLLAQSQLTLRERLAQMSPGNSRGSPMDWEPLFAKAEWGTEQEAFLRILHQFRQQAEAYREARQLGVKDYSQVKPQQIRVPAGADSAAAAILLWERFVYLQVPSDTPILSMLPVDPTWVDITIGEPAADEFFCLRASTKAIPLSSSIPYRLEPDIKSKGDQLLAAMRRNDTPWMAAQSEHPTGMGNKLSAMLADNARKVLRILHRS